MSPLDVSGTRTDSTLQAELATFHKILAKPLTKDLVTQLTSVNNISALAGSFAFGTIRWPRGSALLTPKRADAFGVTLYHTQTFPDYQADGLYLTMVMVPDYPPTKWDGPDDEEFLRVSFLAAGLRRDIVYTVSVQFTPLAKWEHTIAESRFRFIEPASRNFKLNDGAIIDPFDVKTQFFPLPLVP